MRIDSRIDFRLLRCFTVVAEELHFGRAAARLGIAQPPLSQHIKRLERLVGMELFERTSRRVTLTEAGATLLAAAHRATQEMDRGLSAAEEIASGQSGMLTIGYVHLAMLQFLPSLIRSFRQQHPSIRLTMHGIPTTKQMELLQATTLDAAFATDIEPEPGITIHRRWTEPLVYVRPRAGDVDGLVLIPRPQVPQLYDRIIALARLRGINSAVVQEADSWHSVASLVAAGLGVSIAPSSIRKYKIPGLEYESLGRRTPTVAVALVTRVARLSPALQKFVAQAQR